MRHSRNLLSSARICVTHRPFPTISRPHHRQIRSIMSSDADYESFLDKANQDTGSTSKPAAANKASTKAVNTDVPSVLRSVEVDYTSDVDEPFEPVALKWDKERLPSKDEFGSLIGHSDEVSDMKMSDFDPRGHYEKVVSAIKEAASGGSPDIKVFRVKHGSTRAEYYVVALDADKKQIVGLKAKAVES